MSRAAKPLSTPCPSTCEFHSSGQIGTALAAAVKHGADPKRALSADAAVHALRHEQRSLPGGAAVEVAARDSTRVVIADFESRLDDQRSPRTRRDLEAHVARMKADLAKREEAIRDLPVETLVEPLVLLRRGEEALAAARAGGDVGKVAEMARALPAEREKVARILEQRAQLSERINGAVARGRDAVVEALAGLFADLKEKVRVECARPELREVPELVDLPALRSIFAAGEEIAKAGQLVGCILGTDDLASVIPDDLYAYLEIPLRLPGHTTRLAAMHG